MKLTKKAIDSLPPATDRRGELVWDTELRGFAVRLLPPGKKNPKGKKTFSLFYRVDGQQRRPTLGAFGELTVDEARRLAKDMLARVRAGEDPSSLRQDARRAPTVADLADRYLREHARPHKKASSVYMDELNLRNHVLPRVGSRKVAAVEYEHMSAMHHAMRDKPGAANRTLALCSKMFNLAEKWGLRPLNTNPCRHVTKYKERKIHRPLSELELARLAKVLRQAENAEPPEAHEDPRAVAAIRLLMLTGARRGEVLNLRWDEVDLEGPALRLRDSKTGTKVIWLSGAARAVIEAQDPMLGNPYVFPSPRRPGKPLHDMKGVWQRIRKRSKLDDVRIHDLRHAFAATAAAGGLSLTQIGQLLGHRSAQTTKRYAELLDNPAKQAAEKVGSIIARQANGATDEPAPKARRNNG
jgi:integrase